MTAKAQQVSFDVLLHHIAKVYLLHPSAHPALALHRLALDRSLSTLVSHYDIDRFEKAREFAQKTLAGLESLLPYGHPVRAVHQAVLAKLISIGPNGEEVTDSGTLLSAHEQLKKARAETQVAFGGTGILFRDLSGDLTRLERDLEMRRRMQYA